MPKPNFDWVTDPTWKQKIQQAWEEFERHPEKTHLLYKYHHLVDEASFALLIVEESELKPGLASDNAPSLKDMW